MCKAEEIALSKYPKDKKGVLYDLARNSIIEGYKQAEKDNELTWEDINSIKLIIEQVECDYEEQDKKLYTKYFYEEVLKQFKERKLK
jgi:hypothetical protein